MKMMRKIVAQLSCTFSLDNTRNGRMSIQFLRHEFVRVRKHYFFNVEIKLLLLVETSQSNRENIHTNCPSVCWNVRGTEGSKKETTYWRSTVQRNWNFKLKFPRKLLRLHINCSTNRKQFDERRSNWKSFFFRLQNNKMKTHETLIIPRQKTERKKNEHFPLVRETDEERKFMTFDSLPLVFLFAHFPPFSTCFRALARIQFMLKR